tara:strand:+ start:37968 stop:38135 length:168 start_codon:yes stop_codon:yes gene_type:complete
MNDDDKELLKNLDMLINMELLQNEKDWDMIQNLEDAEKTDGKSTDEPEDLKLEEE